jgi:hypothetical protein
MHRWARLIIALVLAAALPLQGIAAATLQACAPPSDAAVPGASVHDTPAADSSPHAMHHHQDASGTMKVAGSAAGQASPAAPVATSKCSVCAVCCAGAALPTSSITFDAAAPTEAFVATLRSPTPAFLTAGFERPPRPFLA